MAGTLEGGAKARTKNLANNPNYYKDIGKLGGLAPTKKKKGFAHNNTTLWQKILRKPSRASVAGRVGGLRSKRGKSQ